jgi:hypothetical protein
MNDEVRKLLAELLEDGLLHQGNGGVCPAVTTGGGACDCGAAAMEEKIKARGGVIDVGRETMDKLMAAAEQCSAPGLDVAQEIRRRLHRRLADDADVRDEMHPSAVWAAALEIADHVVRSAQHPGRWPPAPPTPAGDEAIARFGEIEKRLRTMLSAPASPAPSAERDAAIEAWKSEALAMPLPLMLNSSAAERLRSDNDCFYVHRTEIEQAVALMRGAPAAGEDGRLRSLRYLKESFDQLAHKFERAGGIVKVAHEGVQLGAASWAAKVTGAMESMHGLLDELLAAPPTSAGTERAVVELESVRKTLVSLSHEPPRMVKGMLKTQIEALDHRIDELRASQPAAGTERAGE